MSSNSNRAASSASLILADSMVFSIVWLLASDLADLRRFSRASSLRAFIIVAGFETWLNLGKSELWILKNKKVNNFL